MVIGSAPRDPALIERTSRELEAAGAEATIRWAAGEFQSELVLACSFQDCVIVDLAVQADPRMEVIFLDTGYHFPETLEFVEQVRGRYDLNLTVTQPGADAEPWPCGTAECCQRRKVAPLGRALRGKRAWITGLRRADAGTRSDAPVVGWDAARGMIKINPLAAWSDQDLASYVADRHLPEHPLFSRGYLSIGCAPTTRPVAPGADPRSGRWADSDKTECGLHT